MSQGKVSFVLFHCLPLKMAERSEVVNDPEAEKQHFQDVFRAFAFYRYAVDFRTIFLLYFPAEKVAHLQSLVKRIFDIPCACGAVGQGGSNKLKVYHAAHMSIHSHTPRLL